MVEIYGTLGPSCASIEILEEMFRSGMTGMRLNLSHISLADAAEQVEAFHTAAARAGISPKLLIDMQGPELRAGALTKPIPLEAGQEIELGGNGIPMPAAVLEKLAVIDRMNSGMLDRYKAALEKGEICFDDVFGS